MNILLLGGRGQLGTDLVKTNPGHVLASLDHTDLDVAHRAAALIVLAEKKYDWVINTAAFNRTEEAEERPQAAFAVNAEGAGNVAAAARQTGTRVLHVSTDFVFDGAKGAAYVESDAPRPLSVYGNSKLEGERLVLAESSENLVVRSASLFGAAGSSGKGGNFVEAVLKKARSGQPVSVVHDIVMSPTYTRDLAERLWQLAGKGASGLYHVANVGACSWYEFASEALRLAGLPPPRPVPAAEYPTKMKRAHYTALSSERTAVLGLAPLRPWREALKAYLVEKGHVS